MKKSFFRVCSVLALCLLLSDPLLACEGARSGLLLWAEVVLPTLLPFMICSNVIVALDAVHILVFPVKGILRSVFRLSGAGSYCLVSGLLCGYPMGAKNCSDFLDEGRLSPTEARYLLAISNHPSPMFLLGYAALKMSSEVPDWKLLCAMYLPIFPVAFLAARIYGLPEPAAAEPPAPKGQMNFDESLMSSCEVMVKIGGYIMLFSILAAYIARMPIESAAGKALLLGLIEITTGIRSISASIPGIAGGLFIAGASAFGGLSGIFQTRSVIKNAGLSIRHYITWKAVHSFFTMILFILLAYLLPA